MRTAMLKQLPIFVYYIAWVENIDVFIGEGHNTLMYDDFDRILAPIELKEKYVLDKEF